MYRTLTNLRILRLASELERTLEGYEEDLRNRIPEVPVRARLAHLFEDGPAHAALKQALAEALEQAHGPDGTLQTQDILQSLLDCERVAHEFYLFQLDRLPDQRLVTLFRQLADEEAAHIRAVEDAIHLLAVIEREKPPVAETPQP